MVVFIYFAVIIVAVCPMTHALIIDSEHRSKTSYNDANVWRRFNSEPECGHESYSFQCSDRTCLSAGKKCDGTVDCPDGSDETYHICRNMRSPAACVLPNHPDNGIYRMSDGVKYMKYSPGSIQKSFVILNVTCKQGFKLVGEDFLFCNEGIWRSKFHKCERACKLEKSQSVNYRCIIEDEGYEGTRKCDEYEVEGTMVQPECRKPNYYSITNLHYMLCHNGEWSYKPRCEAECGTLPPHAQPLVVGGREAAWGEVPWHAGVYNKRLTPITQICGASLLSEKVLISAAHCFWNSKHIEPTENYAVAVGKLYREWGHPFDLDNEQTSDLKSISIPRHYRGATLNYQHDLAILVVSQPFSYRPHIRPLCINFPQNFIDMELKNDDVGKVSGWGLTTAFIGSESPKLKVLEMPYIDFAECLNRTPDYYQDYFSGDKFCGGFTNGTSLCKGDSGGGFAFPVYFHGRTRYFLRGIVSTTPPLPEGLLCNIYTFTSFTDVLKYMNFIMMRLA